MRWIKFQIVGAMGVGAQLAGLAFFHRVLGLPDLAATALAVECAILHNFLWHERWTWRDRAGQGSRLGRWLRFQAGAGLISLAVNLPGMELLAGRGRLPYLLANLLCIACGAVANFLAADAFAFRAGCGII